VRVKTNEREFNRTGSGALLAGGLAAILASTCCLGPVVLVALGLSGAWIGNLTLREPYRLFFIAGALVALFLWDGGFFGQYKPVRRVKCAQCQGLPPLQNRIWNYCNARSRRAGISWPSFSIKSRLEEELS
jgi:mercuric ion transport protein